MTATYTFDVFSSLDGFGSADSSSNWTGYWGKQGPELLDRRLALYSEEQRMVFGANTHRAFARMLASSTEDSDVRDAWVTRMRSLPATVVSTTLEDPLDWPEASCRERRRRRGRCPAQGGVRGAVALARQPVDEPGTDGRRSGRPRPGDAISCDHRSDRGGPRLPGCGRLRPRAAREPDPRRQHPGAHLPTHSARLNAGRRSASLTSPHRVVVEPPLEGYQRPPCLSTHPARRVRVAGSLEDLSASVAEQRAVDAEHRVRGDPGVRRPPARRRSPRNRPNVARGSRPAAFPRRPPGRCGRGPPGREVVEDGRPGPCETGQRLRRRDLLVANPGPVLAGAFGRDIGRQLVWLAEEAATSTVLRSFALVVRHGCRLAR